MSRKQVKEYLSLADFQWENHRVTLHAASVLRALGESDEHELVAAERFLGHARRYEERAAEIVAAMTPREAKPYLLHRLAAIRLAAFAAVT